MTRKEKASDAVEILRNRYVKDDPERKASVEAERVNTQVARMIHDLRNDAGLTQKELAELVGTTQSVISRLEDADYEGHSLTMLHRIAEALKQKMTVVMTANDPEVDERRRAFHLVWLKEHGYEVWHWFPEEGKRAACGRLPIENTPLESKVKPKKHGSHVTDPNCSRCEKLYDAAQRNRLTRNYIDEVEKEKSKPKAKPKEKLGAGDSELKMIAECTFSLAGALQRAGGACTPSILDMKVSELIALIAPNGIRFEYEEKP